MITLDTELLKIRGLGGPFLARLEKLGIRTVRNLLWHFPFRYDDFSSVSAIADLQVNENATVRGVVKHVDSRRSWRRNMTLIEATIADRTGNIRAIWFNQPYIAKILRPGLVISLAGKVVFHDESISFSNPAYEIVRPSEEMRHTGGLIPIYAETKGLTSRGIRYLVKPLLQVITNFPDFIPEEILKEANLPSLTSALKSIHFPQTLKDAEQAKRRFAFEDLFLLQVANLKLRSTLSRSPAIPLSLSEKEKALILGHLPFTLTPSQGESLEEILADLAKSQPMNRLLQGDVGSGKTVIAAVAAITAAFRGTQAAFMAPTEVLARQHYHTLIKLFGPLFTEYRISVGFLTGSEVRLFYGLGLEEHLTNRKGKDRLIAELKRNEIKIVVGTHALLSQTPEEATKNKESLFPHLGLIIVDEQHRFGVEQRAQLTKRQSSIPHFLSMSATPIPRTLSLTLFGDLDLSTIRELPHGRKPITTKIVDPENREKAYEFVRTTLKEGRQAFVICPRIELSVAKEDADEASPSLFSPSLQILEEVRAVKEEYEKLSQKIFLDFSVGMLHGKMKPKEKAAVMADFQSGKIQLLVSTSVVEVGVDVPNATIMIIEGAERFGLAQLYQFRGRIGRGEHQSYCFLFTSNGHASPERLHALLKAQNGFELAEQDLALRGPGQFLGDRQTGLPDLAMQSLTDVELIKQARRGAEFILSKDPQFTKHPALTDRLKAFQTTIHFE